MYITDILVCVARGIDRHIDLEQTGVFSLSQSRQNACIYYLCMSILLVLVIYKKEADFYLEYKHI